MAKLQLKTATTSKRIKVRFRDTSETTKNKGLTGLVHNSAGLACYYHRDGDTAATAVSLVTATVGTFTSGGFREIDATNLPGVYEFGVPNAALSTAGHVSFVFKGATNMEEYPFEIEVTGTDNQDATAGGIARLDAAVSSRLAPTVAARTLDVSSGGEAGIDWANVGSPTTTLSLSGTSIASVAGAVGSVTGAVGSVTGNVGGSTASVTGNLGGDVAGKVLGGGSGTITGDGVRASSVTGAVGSVTGAVGSVTGLTNSTIAAAVWDLSTTGHTTSGTFGAAMNAAGSAGDPWATNLPGSYTSGTAGYILGTNLDAAISTRSTYAGGAVASVTGAVGSVTGSVGSVTGNVGGNVNGNVVGSTASVSGSVGSVTGAVGSVTGSVGSVAGSVGGSVASVAGAVGSVSGNVAGDVGGKVLGGGSGTITGDGVRASSVTGAVGSVTGAVGSVTGLTTSTIAAAVWDLSTTGHTTSGTFGAAMSAAGAAGDPWSTSLPGSYGSGTAGNIVGNRLDAAISTRSTYAGGAVASVTGAVGSVTGSVGSVVATVTASVSDKTGFKLASDGLDSISITAPTGVAANFREMMVQLWRRFFKKVTMTATQTKTYADNGSDVLTTQTNSDDGTTQTIGTAS